MSQKTAPENPVGLRVGTTVGELGATVGERVGIFVGTDEGLTVGNFDVGD